MEPILCHRQGGPEGPGPATQPGELQGAHGRLSALIRRLRSFEGTEDEMLKDIGEVLAMVAHPDPLRDIFESDLDDQKIAVALLSWERQISPPAEVPNSRRRAGRP